MRLMRRAGQSATQVSAEAVRGVLPRSAVGHAGGVPPWARWVPSSAPSNALLPVTRVPDYVTLLEPCVACIAHRQAWPVSARGLGSERADCWRGGARAVLRAGGQLGAGGSALPRRGAHAELAPGTRPAARRRVVPERNSGLPNTNMRRLGG